MYGNKYFLVIDHGGLIGKLDKFVQYEINYFCLCRPVFHELQTIPILVVPYTYLFKLSSCQVVKLSSCQVVSPGSGKVQTLVNVLFWICNIV